MISVPHALELRLAGVRWRPSSGDSFVITREGFEGDIFVVSDMTIESHEFETGDRKSTRLNSSHVLRSRMPSSA